MADRGGFYIKGWSSRDFPQFLMLYFRIGVLLVVLTTKVFGGFRLTSVSVLDVFRTLEELS